MSKVIYTIYDGNGDVSELINAGDGAIAGHYEYSPFGGTVALTGSLAKENSFRFSTKYNDSETGLYYYGHRFYLSEIGRWASRDLVGTHDFLFCRNSPITINDPVGLAEFSSQLVYVENYQEGKYHTDWGGHHGWEFGKCRTSSALRELFLTDWRGKIIVYLGRPIDFPDPAAQKVLQEELGHVNCYEIWHSSLSGFFSGYLNDCVCPECAAAKANTLNAFYVLAATRLWKCQNEVHFRFGNPDPAPFTEEQRGDFSKYNLPPSVALGLADELIRENIIRFLDAQANEAVACR